MKYEDVAKRLLTQCEIDQHPVPVEKVAETLGAEITYQPFNPSDNLSGVLFREAGKVTIAVNSKDSHQRQRFTIAHECGHLALKHRGDIFVDQTIRHNRDGTSTLAIDPMEIEANGFAAELLMPRAWVLKEFARAVDGKATKVDAVIKELAGIFEVSVKAMEYRLQNLGLISPDR